VARTTLGGRDQTLGASPPLFRCTVLLGARCGYKRASSTRLVRARDGDLTSRASALRVDATESDSPDSCAACNAMGFIVGPFSCRRHHLHWWRLVAVAVPLLASSGLVRRALAQGTSRCSPADTGPSSDISVPVRSVVCA